ncbi:MAG TPA: MDR family MFS transporter [Burkholderiales bacterium]|jgi:EmrB/QacA subfamily drug resistance transporter|nr:MDR family MFS transporter [Burkholderiales bacterium]
MKPEALPATVSRAEFLNLFFAVFLPMFLAAVDQTLLATATPAIAETLGGLRDTSWIAVGYLLASATVVPVYGRMGDLRGRREMLFVALGIFALGSAACGLAQSLPQLLAARVLQGLGGGGLMTLSQALIGELVPPRERPRFQGYFATVFTSASIGGPVLGGIVVSHASWRWLFLANLPLAAFAAWRIARLPKSERHVQPGHRADVPGHVLFAIGSVSALFWFTSVGHRFAWNSAASLALVGSAAIALGALYRHEHRHPSPFLPVDLLHERTIGSTTLVILLFAACLFAMVFFLPIYLQIGHHVSAQYAGLLLLPITGGMVIAAVTSSQVLRRTGRPRWIPVTGLSLSAVALFLLGILPAHMGLVIVLGFLCGLGFGCVMPTIQVTVQTIAGRERLGVVMALNGLARATGGAAGAALFGAVVFALIPGVDRSTLLQAAKQTSDVAPVIEAFHRAFLVASLVAALAAAIATRMPSRSLWKS